MKHQGDTNEAMQSFYSEMTDSELLIERTEMFRWMTHITESIAIIDGIRQDRAPLCEEAVVLPFREVGDGGFAR